jgi:NitT/TauT family transport system substrate-binding protein
MKKNTFITAALLLAALLACNAPPALADDDYVVKIGHIGSLCQAVEHIAFNNGFLEAEGVKFEIVKVSPGTDFESLASNKTDVGVVLMETAIKPLANGLPAKITSGIHTGCQRILTTQGSGITKLTDLRGKRIGVPGLTTGAFMFAQRTLANAGVRTGDKDAEVEFVVFPNAELPLALQRGAVDAVSIFDPAGARAVKELDLVTIIDQATAEPYSKLVCCVSIMSDDFISKHSQLAAKVTIAFQKAADWIEANHQEQTAKIQVENNFVPGNPAFNAAVLKTYSHAAEYSSVVNAAKAFAVSVKELQAVNIVDKNIDAEQLQKNSFVFLPGVR